MRGQMNLTMAVLVLGVVLAVPALAEKPEKGDGTIFVRPEIKSTPPASDAGTEYVVHIKEGTVAVTSRASQVQDGAIAVRAEMPANLFDDFMAWLKQTIELNRQKTKSVSICRETTGLCGFGAFQ